MRSNGFVLSLLVAVCCVSGNLNAAETSCQKEAREAAYRAHTKKFPRLNSYSVVGQYDLGIADPTLDAFPRRVHSIEIADEASGAVWLVATNKQWGCRVEAIVYLPEN